MALPTRPGQILATTEAQPQALPQRQNHEFEPNKLTFFKRGTEYTVERKHLQTGIGKFAAKPIYEITPSLSRRGYSREETAIKLAGLLGCYTQRALELIDAIP